jgi:hypothetical protein
MSDPTTPTDDRPAGDTRTDKPPEDPVVRSAYIGMGAAIGIGAGIGLVFGTMLGDVALGLACGAGLGVVAGAIMEAGRKRH